MDLARLLAGEALPGDRPLGAARWAAAVVTMELQRGVMGDLASFPELARACEAVDLVATTAGLLAVARRAGVPVVHCTASFREDRAGTVANTPLHAAVLRRPDHLRRGTAATELVAGLGPEPGDLVSDRQHGVSPFAGTSLDALLRNLGARTLVVAGVSLNLGVPGLCIEAANLGYQVVVVTDAVAGVPEDYAARVVHHTLALVATLATAGEVAAALEGAGASAGAGAGNPA